MTSLWPLPSNPNAAGNFSSAQPVVSPWRHLRRQCNDRNHERRITFPLVPANPGTERLKVIASGLIRYTIRRHAPADIFTAAAPGYCLESLSRPPFQDRTCVYKDGISRVR